MSPTDPHQAAGLTEPALPQRFLWLITGLIALHACMASTRVAGSLWVLREGHDERMVGVILSLFAVAPIGLSMWAGRLADRRGLQHPVRLATVMGLLGTAACTAWPTLYTVGLASLMTGGALSLAAVAIQREAGTLGGEGHDLKRIFSWIAIGPALSNVLAPLASGLIIDHLGLRWAFAWCVLMPVIGYALLSRAGRRLAAPSPAAQRAAARPAMELLRIAPLRLLLLINLSMAAAWDAHTFIVPVIGHARDFSASQIGLVLAAFAVAATVVRLIIVRWAGSLDERAMLRGAMGLVAAVLTVYAWLPGVWGLMIGSALMGLALGSVQPMVLSMLHAVTPPDRQGQALGLRMTVTNISTVGMPMLFGVMAAASFAAAPLWLMSLMLLLAQWPAARAWAAGAIPQPPTPPSPDAAAAHRSKAPDRETP